MKEILTLEKLLEDSDIYCKKALAWELFIYPTDTVYGIGWIVNQTVIEAIASYKKRPLYKNYSIIAPSYNWINNNCTLNIPAEELWEKYSKKVDGKWITLLLPRSDKSNFDFSMLTDNDLVWVRIINSPFQQFVTNLWKPFITTSCNISWEKTIVSINHIEKGFQWVRINWWVLPWDWSTIYNSVTWEKIR